MKKNGENKTPKKNYIIVLVVSIFVILLALYVRVIYLNNKDNKDKSIFESENSLVSTINIDDIDFVISEASDMIIYIGYNGVPEIKNMERKLYREIVRNEYTDKVVYLNVSDLVDNKKYISKLKEKFPNIKGDISDAPMMVYIKNGEAVEAVNSEFKMVDYSVLEKLFIKYETSSKVDINYSS